MLNWIVLNRTNYEMDLALNNLQRLICHKTQTTDQPVTSLWPKLPRRKYKGSSTYTFPEGINEKMILSSIFKV